LRSLVVNKHFYDKPYSRNSLHRNIGISHYRKWKHNPVHRRGVKYSSFGGKKSFNNNRFNSRSKFIKQNRIGINDQRRINNRNVSRNSRAVFNGNDSRRVQSNNRVQSGTRINNNITKREIYNGKTNRSRTKTNLVTINPVIMVISLSRVIRVINTAVKVTIQRSLRLTERHRALNLNTKHRA